MIIGEKYQSNPTNSSGRIYEIISFQEDRQLVQMKSELPSLCFATFKKTKVQEWINEGRLTIIPTLTIHSSTQE